jgi:hypothetical protein
MTTVAVGDAVITFPTTSTTLVGIDAPQTFTNKTFGDFICTATTESHLNGKWVIYSFTGTTTNPSATTVATLAVPNNTAITLETNLTGRISSATANANRSACRRITTRVNNVGGTVTVGGNLESLLSSDTNMTAVALSYSASGPNVNIRIASISGGETLSYTLVVQVFAA